MTEEEFAEVVERITQGLLADDFDSYRSAFRLPLVIVPRGGAAQHFDNEDDLREDFDLYVQSMRLQGVTDIFRDVRGIERRGDTARVHYVTHILRRALRIVEPFRSSMEFRRADGEWRIERIESSLGHINWSRREAEIGKDGRFTTGALQDNTRNGTANRQTENDND